MSTRPATQSTPGLLGVGLFVGAPALLAALAILNVLQLSDDRLVIADKQMQVAAFDRRLHAPAADGKPQDLTPIYIKGTSRTLASANLQQYVVDAVSAASGQLIETVPVDFNPADDAGHADEIDLKATLDIDNDGLLQLLYRLESGLPLLDIQTISIRRLPDESGDDKSGRLRVDMAIRGKWRQRAT